MTEAQKYFLELYRGAVKAKAVDSWKEEIVGENVVIHFRDILATHIRTVTILPNGMSQEAR